MTNIDIDQKINEYLPLGIEIYLYLGILVLIVLIIPFINLWIENRKSERFWRSYNQERINALVNSLGKNDKG